jgi:two-component system response regulator WspF
MAKSRVAWRAAIGADAVTATETDPPDVVLLEATSSAAETTRRILHAAPCRVVLLTTSGETDPGDVFEAMGAGAVDAVAVPAVGDDGRLAGTSEILRKLRIAGRLGAVTPQPRAPRPVRVGLAQPVLPLVALGASTGGPTALVTVLGALPASFAGAIIVVQHVGAEFSGDLVRWIGRQIRLPARAARSGDRPQAGTVLVAGGNDDVVLTPDLVIAYQRPGPNAFYHPSVDVFFSSLAANWPVPGLAALLTGIGRDGAAGLLALRDAGWQTIAQDEATSVVYGMPRAAAELCAAVQILPLDEIGPAVGRFAAPAADLTDPTGPGSRGRARGGSR